MQKLEPNPVVPIIRVQAISDHIVVDQSKSNASQALYCNLYRMARSK